MLLSKGAITNVSEIVRQDDFYRASHGVIFRAALDLDAKNEPVDCISLVDHLEKAGQLEAAGGRTRLHELAALVPASANAGHYAQIVRDHSILRGLIRAGSEIARLGWERPGEIAELLNEAEEALGRIVTYHTGSDIHQLGDSIGTYFDQIAEAVKTGVPIFGVRTRLYDLDQITTGLHPGTLTVIAARPSVGKSVLTQNIAENVADDGSPSAIFSLEMSEREIQIRSLSRITKISTTKLRTGRLNPDEFVQVRNALVKVRERPLYVEDDASLNITELRARARRLARKVGVQLIVVDYLQLMAGDTDDKQAEVAKISRNLKLLAKELHIPVIAVSQLNRNVEYREDKRPTLADLRDSGAVEQDADLVAFLYREELYKPPNLQTEEGRRQAGKTELIIAKNRMGEIGTVDLLFFGRRQEFGTPARGAQADAA